MEFFDRFLIIGHRGYSGAYPENTLLAFNQAVEAGANAWEFDVQLSRDGETVVIHDENLERVTGLKAWVREKTRTELEALEVGSWFHPEFKGLAIPSLREVLAAGPATLRFVIELKNNRYPYPGMEEKALRLLTEFGLASRSLLASFNHDAMEKLYHKHPELNVGLIINKEEELEARLETSPLSVFSVSHRILEATQVERLQRRGKKIIVWTVDEEDSLQKYLALRVDGICSNHPDRLARLLSPR